MFLLQIQYFAEILSTKTPHYFIESQFIEKASKELMNRFKLYYRKFSILTEIKILFLIKILL